MQFTNQNSIQAADGSPPRDLPQDEAAAGWLQISCSLLLHLRVVSGVANGRARLRLDSGVARGIGEWGGAPTSPGLCQQTNKRVLHTRLKHRPDSWTVGRYSTSIFNMHDMVGASASGGGSSSSGGSFRIAVENYCRTVNYLHCRPHCQRFKQHTRRHTHMDITYGHTG